MSRALHPAAWWLWAVALAAAASRTTNPLLLGLVIAVTGLVTVRCREDSPWAGSYGVFLRFGLVVIALRVLLHMLLGGVAGPTVLFRLPQVPLPHWAAGIRLGGPVTAEGMVYALTEGLLLVTLLACVGAANALANPRRLLRTLPAALYEVSVAVVVAMTVAPQLVASGRAIHRARLLRGDTSRGWRAVRTILVPVIEDALDRSLVLAAAMDSRGYGRTAGVSPAARRLTGALVLAGLVGMCVGTYGLLDETAPPWIGGPMLGAGLALAAAGLVLGARRVSRTRYRPDRWGAAEVAVAASGLAAAAATLLTGVLGSVALGSADLVPPVVPLGAPRLPLLPALGILVAAAPALLVPRRIDRPDPVPGLSSAPPPAGDPRRGLSAPGAAPRLAGPGQQSASGVAGGVPGGRPVDAGSGSDLAAPSAGGRMQVAAGSGVGGPQSLDPRWGVASGAADGVSGGYPVAGPAGGVESAPVVGGPGVDGGRFGVPAPGGREERA